MEEFRPVPIFILFILVVLLAGAAVLGVILAPGSADLAVQNAAGENLAASTVQVAVTVSITFRGPTHLAPPAPVRLHFVAHPAAQVTPGAPMNANQAKLVNLLKRMSTSSPWSQQGSRYVYGGPADGLVSVPVPPGAHARVLGYARVDQGYLTAATTDVLVSQGAVHETLSQTISFTDIDGYAPPRSSRTA